MARSKCTSPVIYLPKGSWSIRSNHKNSHVRIKWTTPNDSYDSELVDGFKIEGNRPLQVDIQECKDPYIHIYASLDGSTKV